MDVVPQEINNKSEKRNALLKIFFVQILERLPVPQTLQQTLQQLMSVHRMSELANDADVSMYMLLISKKITISA